MKHPLFHMAATLACVAALACGKSEQTPASGSGGTGSTSGGGAASSSGQNASASASGVGGGASQPCKVSDGLDGFIDTLMKDNAIPGLAAGIVTADGLVWAKGYGYADVDTKRAVKADTIFAIMSISKVVTTVGVMQLVEAGKLDLDADINGYLKAFKISHPKFPSAKITMRQLLAHCSGIGGDDYGVLQLNIKKSDAEVQPLGEMLASLLTPQGDRYDNGSNYSNNPPVTAREYSSIGISLAGFVAESIAGTGFDKLTKASIFDPLGMANTSWRLAPYQSKKDQLAVMYNYANGKFEAVEPFTFADYPAGSIRSTVPDLARFVAALIKDGTYGNAHILKPATLDEMRKVPFPTVSASQGHGWSYSLGGRTLVGHGGDDTGASTDFRIDVDTKKGVILFMNVTRRPNTDEIVERLLQESDGCK